MSIPTISHKVKKGETLASIAKAHGFSGKVHAKIFVARYNDKLRKVRSDPTMLAAGDVINIPAVTAAKLTELIKRMKDWRDSLEETLQAMLELKDAELAKLEDDRDYYLSRVKAIQRNMRRGLEPDNVTRRQLFACEMAAELKDSIPIAQIVRCGILTGTAKTQQKEFLKKLESELKIEEKDLKSIQGNIKSVEATIAKSIKATRDAQSLLTDAISATRKLKASTF